MKSFAFRSILLSVLMLLAALVPCRAEDAADKIETEKKALEPLKTYVGQWKGATKATDPGGGWAEDSDWSWEFKDGHAAIIFATPKGKYFTAGRITPGEKAGTYKFDGTLPDGKAHQEYTGELNKTELVLDTANAAEGRPNHLYFELVAKGKRMVMYYQKKTGERFTPIAEVGFTRQGSGFGKETNDHECVITGGLGTIPVTYKGQTYYVCCGGCKSSFNDNPEKELAAYKKRKEEEAKAAK
jgi:hypothetical protein